MNPVAETFTVGPLRKRTCLQPVEHVPHHKQAAGSVLCLNLYLDTSLRGLNPNIFIAGNIDRREIS